MRSFLIAALPIALMAGAFTASAETANQSIQGPGCFNGNGCDNVGFAQSTNGITELDLTANIRGVTGLLSDNNVYTVPTGTSGGGLGLWDYGFSILTQDNGTTTSNGGPTLGSFTYLLTITDTTTGATNTFNPLGIPDDAGWGTSGKTSGVDPSEWGAQNFENPGFPGVGLLPSYDPNAQDTYTVTLTEFNGGAADNIDSITINAVAPEPGTFALGGLVLAGLGLARRKFRKS